MRLFYLIFITFIGLTESSITQSNLPAYAQLERYSTQIFTGIWDTVQFDNITFSKSIYLETNGGIRFDYPGFYRITIQNRGGNTGSDNWNGMRVYGVTSGTVGLSNSVTKISGNDPNQHTFIFMFNILNVNDVYHIEKGRIDGVSITVPVCPQWPVAGGNELPATILAVVEYVMEIIIIHHSQKYKKQQDGQ